MNNILIDSIINYNKEGTYKISLNKDTTINIEEENIKLFIITFENITINFNILNSTTIYNMSTKNTTININLFNKSNLDFYNIITTNEKITNTINVYHKDKETKSNIISRGISYGKGYLSFIINGYIKKGITSSVCNQVSRIINLDKGKSSIKPNLYIEEFGSIANHSAYQGPFDEKTLFYLETKGIKKQEAFKLLLNGFLKMIELPKDYEMIIEENLEKVIRR